MFQKIMKRFKKEKTPEFPPDDQIKYQKPEKWQDWLNIDENIQYWKNKGIDITRLQSGWELGFFKIKERTNHV
jgi:hypothetical protein